MPSPRFPRDDDDDDCDIVTSTPCPSCGCRVEHLICEPLIACPWCGWCAHVAAERTPDGWVCATCRRPVFVNPLGISSHA
jgi:hypothetical protein